MLSKRVCVVSGLLAVLSFLAPGILEARPFRVNARSALLMNMADGEVLYQQNADNLIAPASITKVLSLYIVFEAVESGQLHLTDRVQVSKEAACTGGSRMGLRAGDVVTVEELIKGMAVVSGNDACVAMAEHMSGTVDGFVRRMNAKARELGMYSSVFKTPNGLPAKGQLTSARDIARLSVAYLRRFPESLSIHSMRSYTYNTSTHRNANRLLGSCPGVDGLKTGFVCASGFNLSATAKRGDVRLVAVVMGAQSPGVRAAETTKLLEAGFRQVNGQADSFLAADTPSPSGALRIAGEEGAEDTCSPNEIRKTKVVKHIRGKRTVRTAQASGTSRGQSRIQRAGSVNTTRSVKKASATVREKSARSSAAPVRMVKAQTSEQVAAKKQAAGTGKKGMGAKAQVAVKSPPANTATKKTLATPAVAQAAKPPSKAAEVKKPDAPAASAKSSTASQPKQAATAPVKKNVVPVKANGTLQKEKRG